MVLFIMLYKVVLTLESVEAFATLYKVVLSYEPVDEILKCGHSNNSY